LKPKIFVGTLHTCEGDFSECTRMIKDQVDVEVTHFVVSGQPEKAAHNTLWNAWNDVKDKYGLFIKVDADTVVRDVSTFSLIWAQFQAEPRLTGIQAPLHDYMTDGLINGLNCSSPKVIYSPTLDGLYCDRGVDSGHDLVYRNGQLPAGLVPAGFHCHRSTEEQAFHYGLHRALKNQVENMARVKSAWVKGRDRIRGMALIGQLMAPYFSRDNHNYSDPLFQQMFNEAQSSYDSWIP
jgi:hypothetical protein